MSTTDPVELLERLRPAARLETLLPARDRETMLQELLRADRDSPVRDAHQPARRWLVGIGVSTVMLASVGTAAAAGLLPQSFTEVFSSWEEDGYAQLSETVRAGTAPGPDGSVFSVVTSRNEDGSFCAGAVFESPESAAGSVPSVFAENGSSCEPTPNRQEFGTNSAGSNTGSEYVFQVSAGAATSAVVESPSAEARPLVLANGWLYGWLPADYDGSAVVNGYAADGSLVGTYQVPLLG